MVDSVAVDDGGHQVVGGEENEPEAAGDAVAGIAEHVEDQFVASAVESEPSGSCGEIATSRAPSAVISGRTA
jgi:hypothetical protein